MARRVCVRSSINIDGEGIILDSYSCRKELVQKLTAVLLPRLALPPAPRSLRAEFFEVEHIVKTGETISSTSYSRRPGGKGANCATAIAKVKQGMPHTLHLSQVKADFFAVNRPPELKAQSTSAERSTSRISGSETLCARMASTLTVLPILSRYDGP
jgi:hypothetical protein